jgi:arginine/lysine/ornithine decarboxylase
MKTPIADFVDAYAGSDAVRFHMPGHKGKKYTGAEPFDITEITGADTLYSANGIINESENNASILFGSQHSFYSAEGSSLAIKAMLAIAALGKSRKLPIIAARNAHKSFIHGAALLGLDVEWIYPKAGEHLCSSSVTPEDVEQAIIRCGGALAVYLTSPDYLGNITDISGIAKACHAMGVPLLVDNAHGAYLKFLKPSLHPLDLGCDMCCDSAHKTLPVLTGGAYLHVAKSGADYAESARSMMSMFASTSPSYLILKSLDLCNGYLASGYEEKLEKTVATVSDVKDKIRAIGLNVTASEPLKIVISPKEFGYTGTALAGFLHENNIEIEFADEEYAVLMVTSDNSAENYGALLSALSRLERKQPIKCKQSLSKPLKKRISIRDAALAPREWVNIEDSLGRICASAAVSCPPAVPIAVCGEEIDRDAISLFKKYGIDKIEVVR